jgi:repressor LexA
MLVPALTPRQFQVLQAIYTLGQELGYAPSIPQLCETVGLRSTSSMHYQLTSLKKLGVIHWDEAKKRSLHLPLNVQEWLDAQSFQEEPLEGTSLPPLSRTMLPSRSKGKTDASLPVGQIPIAGTIAAGLPLQTVADGLETLDVPHEFCPTGCFALKVRGYSMVEDHIVDGDIIIVDPKAPVRDGDIVVALVDRDCATLKRIYREADGVRLQPANQKMEPFWVKDVQVQGKLRSVLRKMI